MSSLSSHRRIYLDFLRICASFLVCYNHSDAYHHYLYQDADGSLVSWFMVILSVFARINIPLFFMLSGALLLGKDEPYSVLLRKRVFRFVPILAGVSLVKYLLNTGGEFVLQNFFHAAMSGTVNMSYWYLYAYLAFLMMLPFLRKIARHLTATDVIFLTALRFVMVSFLPVVNYWLSSRGLERVMLSSDLQLPLGVVHFLYYPLMGYYLANVLSEEKIAGKQILLCGVVMVGSVAISSAITYHEGMYAGFTQNYLTLFDYAAGIAFFLIARGILGRITIPQLVSTAMGKLSSFTLGIYLFEPIVGHFFYQRYFNATYYSLHPILKVASSGIWCLFIMGSGCLITWLLRKIPGVRKYL